MLQTLTTTRSRLGTLTLAPVVWVLSHGIVLAQNADVTGALETNQEALTAVADSTFTAEGVEEAAQGSTNALLFALGFAGVAMAGWGIWKLYKITSDGDQARDSAVGPVMMIAIGGLMTITAIVTAIFPNLFVGAGGPA